MNLLIQLSYIITQNGMVQAIQRTYILLKTNLTAVILIIFIGASLSAIFMNQGQMCTAGSRLLVEDKIYNEFVEKLVARAKNLKIGPADNFETEFGPLVSVGHRDAVLKFIEKGKQEGAKLACGGKIPDIDSKGAYLEPTIFTHVRNTMSIAQEEIFGPVLCVMPFTSVEEAI